MDIENASFATQAVHAGQHGDPVTGALVSPMFMTSTFTWTPEKLERYTHGDKEGIFTYGRSRNPTQNELQDKLAVLEHAKRSLVTASGMAAISQALLTRVHPGDHVICATTCYSGTFALLTKVFEEMKIEVTFVDDFEEPTLEAALRPNTRVVYSESIFNPTMEVCDIERLAKWVHSKPDLKLFIDNTFCSPYLLKPLDLGADVVINSATKYINGHGDLIAGTISSNDEAFMEEIRGSLYQELGPTPSPFSCWLMLRGLKTLHLRMKAHCENAMAVAKWLEANPKIEKVVYPGLESHPSHSLAEKIMGGKGYGGMLCFIVKGGMQAAKDLCYHCEMMKLAVSLGDCDTLIEQPATMTHFKVPKEDREKMGIYDGMVRLSVGIEDSADIIGDLERALEYVK